MDQWPEQVTENQDRLSSIPCSRTDSFDSHGQVPQFPFLSNADKTIYLSQGVFEVNQLVFVIQR